MSLPKEYWEHREKAMRILAVVEAVDTAASEGERGAASISVAQAHAHIAIAREIRDSWPDGVWLRYLQPGREKW